MVLLEIILAPCTVLLTAFTASVVMYFACPSILMRWYMRIGLYSCGMRTKTVQAGDYIWCYAEKNERNPERLSLLLVHGFSASKDMWIQLIKKLPQDLHIIVVDLPGHGQTTELENDDISFLGQAESLHKFIDVIGLNVAPFHLCGTSMGGAIVGLYTANYPKDVALLSMVCPAMKTPDDNEFIKELRAGHCRLIPETPEEMQKMIDSTLYNKRKVPGQILKAIVDLRKPKNPFYHRLFRILANEENGEMLEECLHNILCPTQLIWGDNDELIDVAGAEVLKAGLPNCDRVDILPKCGHSISMDRPGAFAKYLLLFRGELPDKNKKNAAKNGVYESVDQAQLELNKNAKQA